MALLNTTKKTTKAKTTTKTTAAKTTAKTTSPTAQMLALRKDANALPCLATGVWYSGFSNARECALTNGLPFLAVAVKDDGCSLCTKFEGNLLTDVFQTWMAASGIIYWFGHAKDAAKEDRVTGKAWAKNKTLTKFPFVRLYHVNGTEVDVDVTNSGNWWNGGKAGVAGADNIIRKISNALE